MMSFDALLLVLEVLASVYATSLGLRCPRRDHCTQRPMNSYFLLGTRGPPAPQGPRGYEVPHRSPEQVIADRQQMQLRESYARQQTQPPEQVAEPVFPIALMELVGRHIARQERVQMRCARVRFLMGLLTPVTSIVGVEDCPICMEALDPSKGDCIRLPCSTENAPHLFHKYCIQMALYERPTCPLCRADVFTCAINPV
jgi:Ring finger domain